MTFNDIKKNSEINTYIEYADQYLEEVGYTEHAYNHLYRCVKVTEYILETLGYDVVYIIGGIKNWPGSFEKK